MATSISYRGGDIKSISAGSGETLGAGASLLNNNFTKLYDLAVPSSYSNSSNSAYVAGYDYFPSGGSLSPYFRKAITICSGINGDYVPVVYSGDNVRYVPLESLVSQNANTPTTSNTTSKLTHPESSGVTYYYAGSGSVAWESYSTSLSSFTITHNNISYGNSVSIKLPSFGLFMVTGTITLIEENDYDNTTPSGIAVYRFIAEGKDLSVMNKIREKWTGSEWSDCYDGLSLEVSSGNLVVSSSRGSGRYMLSANVVGGQDGKVAGMSMLSGVS